MLIDLPRNLSVFELLYAFRRMFFKGIVVFLIVLSIVINALRGFLILVSVSKRAKEGVFNKSMIIIS